ncbi:MAG: phenylalanine--tRNA ligase subunit beta [Planctomycetaceae bacterium]|jgi:phenylalanyl-tRNA synthetase beta chain|nr:phenylalanine--tRNA ligase subunit beta [Planctomycetaceae bacterium]
MYISLDWISDFVDIYGLEAKEIANRLTLATAEVEGVEVLRRFVEGVVVGEVTLAETIATDVHCKTLTFCTVDCGAKKYTTVCSAPNARVGLKAPFAPAGTKLAHNVVIQQSEMAGKPSQGILCSASELGMSPWHEIVFECPSSTENGTPFSELVPPTDTLIEIDNKSLTHRPDLWGHYGFAREFSAVFHRPLKPYPQHDLPQYDKLPAFPITLEDQENCPCYTAIAFKLSQGTVPSPIIMQRRLHALGQRTYNLLVDVTNYVNHELGQPTHAFDGDLIQGIRVAQMGKNAKFKTLDGQTRDLLAEDLLIWDTEKPIALAGIMGGLATEVTAKTNTVLLESASFKSGRIRRTASRLDLRTDASQRYEKSQPPANVKVGTSRILDLIERSGAAFEVISRFTVAGNLHDNRRTVTLAPERLEQLAGIRLPRETILEILTSLGFRAKYENDGTLTADVPPHRSEKDISIAPDIIEEILRVYGYDNIPPIMPESLLRPLHVEEYLELEMRAKKLLAGAHRFHEVHNYGWLNDQWLEKIGFDPGETLTLRNPADQSCSRLRTTLIPNLLTLVPRNRTHRDAFRLFELGNAYLPNGNNKIERKMLSGVSYQQATTPPLEEHYREIKGAIEDVSVVFADIPLRFAIKENAHAVKTGGTSQPPWQAADHWAEILQEENIVGAMGVIPKQLREIIVPEGGQIVWFEIDLGKFKGNLYPAPKYAELPRFPGSWQDFSMVWSIDAGFAELENRLDQFAHPLLQKREFLVSYKGKGLEKGMASYSFRFLIGADDHTLSGEEIEAFHSAMLEHLKRNEIALR